MIIVSLNGKAGISPQYLEPLLARTQMCAINCFSFNITIHTHLYVYNMNHIP